MGLNIPEELWTMHELFHSGQIDRTKYNSVRQKYGLCTLNELHNPNNNLSIVESDQDNLDPYMLKLIELKDKLPMNIVERELNCKRNKDSMINLFCTFAQVYRNLTDSGMYTMYTELQLQLTNMYHLDKILYFLIKRAKAYDVPEKVLLYAYNRIITKTINSVLITIKDDLEKEYYK